MDFLIQKTNVKQLVHHVAIFDNIIFFLLHVFCLFFAPRLPFPSINCQYTRDERLHLENRRPRGLLTTRSEYDHLGRLHRRDEFTVNAQRPSPRRWSRRLDYDYRNNLVREERDDNPFSWYRWQYDSARWFACSGRHAARTGAVALGCYR